MKIGKRDHFFPEFPIAPSVEDGRGSLGHAATLLEAKFGLSFTLVDREYLATLRRERGYTANPWSSGSRFIISHSLMADETYIEGLRDLLGNFRPRALLILDEAHHAAPASGFDASTKRDSSALVAVTFDKKTRCVRLVAHKVFTPSPGNSINFEDTIEKTLREWRGFRIRQILFDPFQMAAVAQRLTREGLPVEEYPQTLPNLTAATSNLFDLVSARQLLLYPDAGMRLAISHAIIVESSRGWRLDKLKQSHKIDVVVALSMAALAAVRDGGKPYYDRSLQWVCGDEPLDLHRQEQLAFNRFIMSGGAR